jgi:glycosyltransferase involved in cell wall biosynthesis
VVVGHSCVLSWWLAVKREPAPPAWNRYRREVAAGLAGAGRVVAPSATMMRALERHYGPLARTAVIRNGRRAEAFRPGAKQPFVLSAGRLWDEAKNVGALARVARGLPWPVKVAGAPRPAAGIGGGPGFDGCGEGGCEPLGRLGPAAMAAAYAQAAIYALPARYEPFGLTVLEAALAGCALVLGDIPSLRELWHDAALFVPPGDDQALARGLASLIARPGLRALLAGRSRARASRYSAALMVRRYLALYRSLLAPPRSVSSQEDSRACVS